MKHRVRNLIADAHWQTDGEWKESVLRQILRRQLPATAIVSRGFVVTERAVTHQLDVLIRHASKPVLFRDGDLVLVTPDAVLGIIEVKSRLTPTSFVRGDVALSVLSPHRHQSAICACQAAAWAAPRLAASDTFSRVCPRTQARSLARRPWGVDYGDRIRLVALPIEIVICAHSANSLMPKQSSTHGRLERWSTAPLWVGSPGTKKASGFR